MRARREVRVNALDSSMSSQHWQSLSEMCSATGNAAVHTRKLVVAHVCVCVKRFSQNAHTLASPFKPFDFAELVASARPALPELFAAIGCDSPSLAAGGRGALLFRHGGEVLLFRSCFSSVLSTAFTPSHHQRARIEFKSHTTFRVTRSFTLQLPRNRPQNEY